MKFSLLDKSKLFFLLSNLGVILLFTLSLTIFKGHNYGAIIFIIAILCIPLWWKNKIIAPHYYKLCFVICFSALTGILNAWLSNDTGLYETPIKYLLSIIILLYLMTYPPKIDVIWWSISIGAIGAGILAIHYNFDETIYRSSKHLNPIHFGNYSMLFSMICICALFPSKGHSKPLIFSLLLGTILGFSVALLTESRGSWLSFIITMAFLILINLNKINKNKLLKFIFPLFILLISSILFFGKDRINLATNEIKNYQTNKSSSVGLRLEMLRFGLFTGMRHPFFGASSEKIDQEKKQWIKQEGKDSEILLGSDHLHNEFIDIFALKGMIGLCSLLLLFLYPLAIYLKSHKHISIHSKHTINQLRLSNASITHIIAFIGFGLTESVILRFNNAVILFIIPLWIFYATYNKEKNKHKNLSD